MNTPESAQYLQADELRGILDDAIRFWELRRVPYNLVLAAVVVIWVVPFGLGGVMFTWQGALALFVMAAFANVLYSVAYCLDVFVQFSSFRDLWRRRRWMLWLAGTLLAVALANVWIISQIN